MSIICGSTAILFVSLAVLASITADRKTVQSASFTSTDQANHQTFTQSSAGLFIDVSGAVVKPGVYQLPTGSRVEDAIQAAGGFDEGSVDRDFVAREFNLAAKVQDGQKLYILHKGEDRTKIPVTNLTLSATNGKININTASTTELESLSGVGAVTASKIITNRPYQSANELVSKKVLSQSLYNKIASLIATN